MMYCKHKHILSLFLVVFLTSALQIDALSGRVTSAVRSFKAFKPAVTSSVALRANFSTKLNEGPVARINLLQGQLANALPQYRDSSLVHGAIYSEFGIIKSLYTLLVTPKKVILDDGRERLVPDSSFNPLGTLMQQFFYLAGGTLAPTKRTNSCVYRLTPAELGYLYKTIMDDRITVDFNPTNRNMGGGRAKREEYEATRKLLMETLIACRADQDGDLAKIYPSVIRAFFWSKFVSGAETTSYAAEQIASFAKACGESSANVVSQHDLEASCLQRLIDIYDCSLPKPPIQGTVTLSSGHRFPDCGESGLRGFFNAAFYDQASNSFIIPASQKHWYDPKLVNFYEQYSTIASQATQGARNAWGEVLSNRSNLKYGQAGICDLHCAFPNVVKAMAELVPGINQQGKTPQELLFAMAEQHGLAIKDFQEDQSGRELVSWKLVKAGGSKSFLAYWTRSGHLSCELQDQAVKTVQLQDPLIGCVDNISVASREPDKYHPLLFAGARMARQQDYVSVYLAILSLFSTQQVATVTSNVEKWGLLTPEDKRIIGSKSAMLRRAVKGNFTRISKNLISNDPSLIRAESSWEETILDQAVENDNSEIVEEILKAGAKIGQVDFGLNKAFIRVAKRGKLDQLKVFLKYGVDINLYRGRSALIEAADEGRAEVVDCLLKNGAHVNQQDDGGSTALMKAVWSYVDGNKLQLKLEIIKSLLAAGADVDLQDILGYTALSYAAVSGNQEACKLLLLHGANPNPQGLDKNYGLVWAAKSGHIDVVRLLLDHGASIDAKDEDGCTALSATAYHMVLGVMKLLLERGAQVNIGNRRGITALRIANKFYTSCGDPRMRYLESEIKPAAIKLLLEYGATMEPDKSTESIFSKVSKLVNVKWRT